MTETHDQHAMAASLAEATASLRRSDIEGMTDALRRLSLADCSAAVRFEAAKLFGSADATSDAIKWFLEAGAAFIDPEGDLDRAREAFNHALALDPQDLDIVFEIGRVEMIDGNLQRALAHFEHVLRKSKNSHAPALFETGCIYEQLGKHDQAVLTFRKFLDRDKSNVQAIVHMGQRLQTMGMLPEAVGYFMQAAVAAHTAGQMGTCRHVINLVIGLDPNNQHARRLLAELDDHHAAIPDVVAVKPDGRSAPEQKIRPNSMDGLAAISDIAKLTARLDRMQRKLSDAAGATAKLEETVAGLKADLEAITTAKKLRVSTPAVPKKVALERASSPIVSEVMAVAKPAKPRSSARPKAPTPRR